MKLVVDAHIQYSLGNVGASALAFLSELTASARVV